MGIFHSFKQNKKENKTNKHTKNAHSISSASARHTTSNAVSHMSGKLRPSSPKYQTIASAIQLLEQHSFILIHIRTHGETSGHMWCVGFDKEYDTLPGFLENAAADYQAAAAECKNGGPNREWASTHFTLVRADNVLVHISIVEDDGDSSPQTATYMIVIPQSFSEEKQKEFECMQTQLEGL